MRKRLTATLATGALIAAMVPAGTALAQDGAWTEVTGGIDAPRGLAFGPDGMLYVAIAGSGGDQCMEAPNPEGGDAVQVCVGATAQVIKIDTATGSAEPVITDLPSTFITSEGVLGVPDVTVSDDGTVYLLTSDGNVPDAAERPEGDLGGIVWQLDEAGAPVQVADLVAFEAAANPDGGLLDSNPNGVTIGPDGALLVADAGANALVKIAAGADPAVVATFPDMMAEMPAMGPEGEAAEGEGAEGEAEGAEGQAEGPQMIPQQAVPTHVVVGPDGASYVTFLTGFPFTPGASWVARVAEDGEVSSYAEGLTNVIGAAFASDGTLYVLELATNGMLSGDMTGALWSVPPGGGEPTLVTTEGLMAPGGIAINDADEIFVSNGSVMPGVGAIVKLNQE